MKFLFKDSKISWKQSLYFQAIQGIGRIPENVDAIRTLMGTESDWKALSKKPIKQLHP